MTQGNGSPSLRAPAPLTPTQTDKKGDGSMAVRPAQYSADCDRCGNAFEDHYWFCVNAPTDFADHGWTIAADGAVTCSDCAYLDTYTDRPASAA